MERFLVNVGRVSYIAGAVLLCLGMLAAPNGLFGDETIIVEGEVSACFALCDYCDNEPDPEACYQDCFDECTKGKTACPSGCTKVDFCGWNGLLKRCTKAGDEGVTETCYQSDTEKSCKDCTCLPHGIRNCICFQK